MFLCLFSPGLPLSPPFVPVQEFSIFSINPFVQLAYRCLCGFLHATPLRQCASLSLISLGKLSFHLSILKCLLENYFLLHLTLGKLKWKSFVVSLALVFDSCLNSHLFVHFMAVDAVAFNSVLKDLQSDFR